MLPFSCLFQSKPAPLYLSLFFILQKIEVLFEINFIFQIFRHRAINLFLRTYRDMWLTDENVGQEIMIEHLTVRYEYFFTVKKT